MTPMFECDYIYTHLLYSSRGIGSFSTRKAYLCFISPSDQYRKVLMLYDRSQDSDIFFEFITSVHYMEMSTIQHRCPSRLKTDRCHASRVKEKKLTRRHDKSRKPSLPLPWGLFKNKERHRNWHLCYTEVQLQQKSFVRVANCSLWEVLLYNLSYKIETFRWHQWFEYWSILSFKWFQRKVSWYFLFEKGIRQWYKSKYQLPTTNCK